jgi:hypothetical protein
MIYRTILRVCEPGLETPIDKSSIAIEGYLLKKKSTRVYRRVWVKRYVILSHERGGKIYILNHQDSKSSYDIIDLSDCMYDDEDHELDLDFLLGDKKEDSKNEGGEDGQGPSVSLETGEIIEDSDDEDEEDHDIIGVSVSHPGEIHGGKVEGSRFLINDNGYRDYKFEAESPEMAAVWIHRIRLVLRDVRVAKTVSMKKGTEFLEEYRKQLDHRLHAPESLDPTSFQAENNRFFGAHSQYKDYQAIVWPILEPLDDQDEQGSETKAEEQREGVIPGHNVSSHCENERENYTGRARLTYKDGSVYEGDVVLGLRDGKGAMKYEDGKVYIGEFRDDKREGRGLLKQRQGPQERKLYCGTFRDDSLMLDKHAQLW